MSRDLPSREHIQKSVLGIMPNAYFERLLSRPGMLVLRAKEPECEWRGLHIALSESRRVALLGELRLLLLGKVQEFHFQSSYPEGRAWFNLYTSGVNFGAWRGISFEMEASTPHDEIWVRYSQSSVTLRMAATAVSEIEANLARSLSGGIRSSLRLMRDVKPLSTPHSLWFWQWAEHANAG